MEIEMYSCKKDHRWRDLVQTAHGVIEWCEKCGAICDWDYSQYADAPEIEYPEATYPEFKYTKEN